MKLTCSQMDVLISFYIDNELSKSLKEQVETHLKSCPNCRAKYDIIKSMLVDMKSSIIDDESSFPSTWENTGSRATSQHYRVFKNNLSAYIDNELPTEENIKIKKFTINNKKARKDLEDSYNIRRLMNESYLKSKTDAKYDFSKNILKQLEPIDDETWGLHPIIILVVGFLLAVIVISTIVLFMLGV